MSDSSDSYFLNIWLGQLCDHLVPHIMKAFQNLYNDAHKINKHKPLMMFQLILERIRDLPQSKLDQDYNVLCRSGTKPKDLEKMLDVIFATSARMYLVSQGASKKKVKIKRRDLNVPDNVTFLHKCYIEAARSIWMKPQLFHRDGFSFIEQQNHYNEATDKVKDAIHKTVRNMIPYQQLQYRYLDDAISEYSSRGNSNLQKMLAKEKSIFDIPTNDASIEKENNYQQVNQNNVDQYHDNNFGDRHIKDNHQDDVLVYKEDRHDTDNYKHQDYDKYKSKYDKEDNKRNYRNSDKDRNGDRDRDRYRDRDENRNRDKDKNRDRDHKGQDDDVSYDPEIGHPDDDYPSDFDEDENHKSSEDYQKSSEESNVHFGTRTQLLHQSDNHKHDLLKEREISNFSRRPRGRGFREHRRQGIQDKPDFQNDKSKTRSDLSK